MTTTTRSLRSATHADAAAILAVLTADDLHEIGRVDSDETDVAGWWALPHMDIARDTWVLEEAGAITGYGQTMDGNRIGRYDSDAWVVHEHDWAGFEQLMHAIELRARELSAERDLAKCELVTYAVMGREVRALWLTELGFSHVRRFYRMEVELDVDDPALLEAPEFPTGTTVERVGQAESVQREYHAMMSAAFREHWGHVDTDFEGWLERHSASPNLNWDTVWLVRVDGVPAAGLKMRMYDDITWVDTIGTLKEFRGRGFAALLLRTAFAESLRKGQPRVELGVDTENVTSAVALYERSGMTTAFAHDEWSKSLS